MKAINVSNGTGPAESPFFDEIPDPELKGDDILVRIKAFGINRADIMQRDGTYPMCPIYPKIMGLEFAGIVEAKGPQASDTFKTGDHLFGLSLGGALSWEQGASLPEVFFTAVQVMRLVVQLKPGEDILIHAGASGIGLAAIQIAKLFHANKIFITAGTSEKCQLWLSLGADFAINYRTISFSDIIAKETNGKGVNVILDMVGASYWARNIEVAAMDARIVVIVFMSGSQIADFDMMKVLKKRISILTTQLRSRGKEYQSSVRDIFRDEVLPALVKGEIKTVIDGVYSWKDIVEAHKRMDASTNAGKIICVVN